jgi:hypothetical protein
LNGTGSTVKGDVLGFEIIRVPGSALAAQCGASTSRPELGWLSLKRHSKGYRSLKPKADPQFRYYFNHIAQDMQTGAPMMHRCGYVRRVPVIRLP